MSAPPHPPPLPAGIDRANPWPGLRTYDESMAAYFFGREHEVEELLRLVRRDAVALFYGQSGLGKSSVLQAGLFPKLRGADFLPVHVRLRYAAEFPAPALQVMEETVAAAQAVGGEAPAPAPDITLFEYFYDGRHDFWSARNRVLTPVLVFDQFEEIFTLGARDVAATQRRLEFLTQVADLVARRPPAALVARFEHEPELAARFSTERTRCRVLFSMREDFLPELGSLREHLPTLATGGGLRLQRLRGNQAREVLERAGAHLLDPGATERIIRFVAAEKSGGTTHELTQLEVEPALLSVVASELNVRRRARGLERISADLVQGARDEILGDFYERALTGLDARVREFIEEQLLTTTGFRDSVAVEDAVASYGVPRDVIGQLVDRRLLRIDERFQMQRVELTHDLLTSVVKTSRDRRREREAVAATQQRADDEKRIAQDAVRAAQAKLRRTRMRVAVAGVVGLLTIGLGVLLPLYHRATRSAEEAERARAEATAALLISAANEQLASKSFDAARLLLSGREMQGFFGAAERQLVNAALSQPPVLTLQGILDLDEAAIREVAFAPGGRLLLLTADDQLRTFTLESGGGATRLRPETDRALTDVVTFDVAWTEPAILATASNKGAITLRRIDTGDVVQTLNVAPAEAAEKPGDTATASQQADAPTALRLRFSLTGDGLGALIADGRMLTWSVPADGWSGTTAVRAFTSRATEGLVAGTTRDDVWFEWAMDQSILAVGPQPGVWLAPPRENWERVAALETFNVLGRRAAVIPAPDFRASELIANPQAGTRLEWLRLPDATVGDVTNGSVSKASVVLPDLVHSIAAVPGANLVAVALQNGTISLYRAQTVPQEALQHLQTVAGPRASRVELRLRRDARMLAAATDDGRVFLYAVEPPPIPAPAPSWAEVRTRVVYDGRGGWITILQDGRVIDGLDIIRDAVLPQVALPDAATLSVHVPEGDLARVLAFLRVPAAGGDSFDIGVWSFAGNDWLWRAPETQLGFEPGMLRGFEQTSAFTTDGSAIIGLQNERSFVQLDARTGQRMALPWTTPRPIQYASATHNGRRIAVYDTNREISMLEVPTEPTEPFHVVATIRTRGDNLSAMAVSAPGTLVGYVLRDGRLFFEAVGAQDTLPPLIIPLADVPTEMQFAPDNSTLLAVVANRAKSFSTPRSLEAASGGGFASETARLEWLNQARLDGRNLEPLGTGGSQFAHLDPALWREDGAGSDATRTIATWTAWRNGTTQTLRGEAAGSPAGYTEVRAALEAGRALAEQMSSLAPRFSALDALRTELQTSTANVVALLARFGSEVDPTRAWELIFAESQVHRVTLLAPAAAAEAFATLTKAGVALPPAQREFAREIIRVLAHDVAHSQKVSDARTMTIGAILPAAAWDEIVFSSPDNDLLYREAKALFDEGSYEASIRYYLELERRDPANLLYPSYRAQNLRYLERWTEAEPIYADVESRARANGETYRLAETLVCQGWVFAATNRPEEAFARMQEARTAMPDNAWTLRNTTLHFLNNERPDLVGDATARLVAVEPNAANLLLHGRSLLANEERTSARAAFEQAVAMDDSARVRYDAAVQLRSSPRQDDLRRAAEWFETAAQRFESVADQNIALKAAGSGWNIVNAFDRALAAFDELLANNPTPAERSAALFECASIRLEMRDFPAARKAVQEGLAGMEDTNLWPWKTLALVEEWQGNPERAFAALRHAAGINALQMAVPLAEAYLRYGRKAEASTAIDAGLAENPNAWYLQVLRAMLDLETAPDDARAKLRALDDDSTNYPALVADSLGGNAARAATLHLLSLDDSTSAQWVAQAGFLALAAQQQTNPEFRLEALQALSNALQRGHRGSLRLGHEFGLDTLQNDAVFQLAERALIAPLHSAASVRDLARFEARLATELGASTAANTHRTRARHWISEGLEGGLFTREEIAAEPLLAPFLGGAPSAAP